MPIRGEDMARIRLERAESDALDEKNRLFTMISVLERENAKLRELVRDMWREGAFEPGACYARAATGLAERTLKLGIEVK